jgi:Tfp pilus assembly protein PilO
VAFEKQIEWYKSQKMAKRMAIVIAAASVLPAYYYSETYEGVDRIVQEAETQLQSAEARLSDVQRKVNLVDSLLTELKNNQAKLISAKEMLPADFHVHQVLEKVSLIAANLNLEISQFLPQKNDLIQPSSRYAEKLILIRTEGKFGDVTRFFDEITRMDRLTHLRDVRLRQKPIEIKENQQSTEEKIDFAIRTTSVNAEATLVLFRGVNL